MELCNDMLFEIFLRLPPEVLPRLTILNKQSSDMINSPLFQTTYWAQKLQLPRLYAMVYYQRKLTNRIGSVLINKENAKRLDRNEFHRYTQVPRIRFPSSYYTRLLQWTETMLHYYEMGANSNKIQKANEWLMPHQCNRWTSQSITLHSAGNSGNEQTL